MDWIRHGWGKDLAQQPIPHEDYYIDGTGIVFSENQGVVNALKNIELITKTCFPPYYVAVSGGIDSQATAWAWKLSGVPHTLVSFKYDIDYNEHDLHTLKEFTEKYGLKVEYINLSLFDFFEERMESYAIRYNCDSPHICTHMLYRETIKDGTLIYSGGPAKGNTLELTYSILGLRRYQLENRANMVPTFFCNTPELAGSFYTKYESLVKQGGLSNYEIRYRTYWELGFPVIPQSKKYSGFEKYKMYYDVMPLPPAIRIKYAKYESKRVFDIRFRYMIGEKLILPSKTFTTIQRDKYLNIIR